MPQPPDSPRNPNGQPSPEEPRFLLGSPLLTAFVADGFRSRISAQNNLYAVRLEKAINVVSDGFNYQENQKIWSMVSGIACKPEGGLFIPGKMVSSIDLARTIAFIGLEVIEALGGKKDEALEKLRGEKAKIIQVLSGDYRILESAAWETQAWDVVEQLFGVGFLLLNVKRKSRRGRQDQRMQIAPQSSSQGSVHMSEKDKDWMNDITKDL